MKRIECLADGARLAQPQQVGTSKRGVELKLIPYAYGARNRKNRCPSPAGTLTLKKLPFVCGVFVTAAQTTGAARLVVESKEKPAAATGH